MLCMFLYTWQDERCDKLQYKAQLTSAGTCEQTLIVLCTVLAEFKLKTGRLSYDVVVSKFDRLVFKMPKTKPSLRASGYRFTTRLLNGAERSIVFIWEVNEEAKGK